MADEQVENQGRGEEQILSEAKSKLQKFLDENYKLMRALRSEAQFVHLGVSLRDHGQELQEYIKQAQEEASKKDIFISGTGLKTVTDDKTEYEHTVNAPLQSGEVRTMSFRISQLGRGRRRGINFTLWDLDTGPSRQYYDQKSEEEKENFVRKALYRANEYVAAEHEGRIPRVSYGAFISDQGGKYIIEKIV